MIPAMDGRQEQELRAWAKALTRAGEADRKAMGRAILMLLGQIDSLRAELDRAAEPPVAAPPEAAPADKPAGTALDESTETLAVYDTGVRRRDRLRIPGRQRDAGRG
jgi:hypothetical protein